MQLKFRYKFEVLSLLIFVSYFIPIFILGKSAYILIPDNLNADFFIKFLMEKYGLIFNFSGSEVIPSFYSNGLELKYISPRFFIGNLFFLFNDPFYAYLLNAILIRIIAFFTFLSFLKTNFGEIKHHILLLVSLSFSLIPLYSIYGLTILGLPMLLNSFINIYNFKKVYWSFLAIILYVGYSTVLLYPFLFLIMIIYYLKKRYLENNKFNYKGYLLGIAVFITTILITESDLLLTIFSGESHRSIRGVSDSLDPTLKGIVYGLIKKTLLGFDHPSQLISIPILIYALINIKHFSKNSAIILFLILITNFLDLTRPIYEDTVSFIKVFDLGRINWLNPPLFFILLVNLIRSNTKQQKLNPLIYLIIVSQISLNFIRNPEFSLNIMDNDKASNMFFNDDYFVKNIPSFRSNPYDLTRVSALNYEEFFSKSLFNEISSFINRPKESYKVVGFGLDPSILLFNGFYTLDGYSNNHSKDYHVKFDSIQPNFHLGGSHILKLNFDECINCSRDFGKFKIKTLDLNFDLLIKNKCEYIISTVEIINTDSNLKLLNKFSNKFYEIFLYEIKS